MNKKGVFEAIVMTILVVVALSLFFLYFFHITSQPDPILQCKTSCSDLNFTYYKYYLDGAYSANIHCFCFDKENKPIDIGKP